MSIVMNKSVIIASAAFVCANASDSQVADVTTQVGFTAESTGGLRVFRDDAAGSTYPDKLAGVFQQPVASCVDTPGQWTSCAAYSTAPEAICFGGSSKVAWADNVRCEVGGDAFNAAATIAEGKVWYDIGGADNPMSENTWWTQTHVDNLNAKIKSGAFPTDKFIGIFYDLELIHDVDIDFNASFQIAKDAGLQVMVSTSYTFPYGNLAPGYPGSLVNMFTKILQDTNVDILAPQFYQDGLIYAPALKGIFDFDTWTDLVPQQTKVMPIFRVTAGKQWSEITTDFNAQVKAAEDKCATDSSFAIFCRSEKYYLWSAN